MSVEFYAILGVGVSLAALLLSLRADVAALRHDFHALAERVARLEGAFPYLAPARHEPREPAA